MSPELLVIVGTSGSIAAVIVAIFSSGWKNITKIIFLCCFIIFSLSSVFLVQILSRKPANPIIELGNEIRNTNYDLVDPKDAPYIIFVQGTVQNAKGYHTYLVVNDYYHEYIEPISGFGKNVDQNFSGFCYLGKMQDSSSVNKLYSISGVVTTKKYEEYNHLDRTTIVAESNKLVVKRTEFITTPIAESVAIGKLKKDKEKTISEEEDRKIKSTSLESLESTTLPVLFMDGTKRKENTKLTYNFRIGWNAGPEYKKFQIYKNQVHIKKYDVKIKNGSTITLGKEMEGKCEIKTWWDNGTLKHEAIWVIIN